MIIIKILSMSNNKKKDNLKTLSTRDRRVEVNLSSVLQFDESTFLVFQKSSVLIKLTPTVLD